MCAQSLLVRVDAPPQLKDAQMSSQVSKRGRPTPSAALPSLLSSSTSLLHLLNSPSPFPPTISDPSAALLAARATQQRLRDRLETALITGTARRKALGQQHKAGESPEEREQRLRVRLEELRGVLEGVMGQREIRRKVVGALNESCVFTTHLQSQSDESATRAALQKRDHLSLSLLSLHTRTDALRSERTKLRAERLKLNRTNASLVASLRTRPTAASIISTMPAAIQKQNTKISQETLSTLSRHAIIRNVFQLVVVESGFDWYAPEREAEEEEGMGRGRVMRLMLEAGEGTEDWEDE